MDQPVYPRYKKRRIVPKAVATVSDAAMKSAYNKKVLTKVVALERKVNRIQREKELKSFDTAISFTFDSTGEIPSTGQLVLIPQGANAETRNGEKVVITSLQMRASVGLVPAAAATSSTTAHLFLVWDKQANAAAAAVGDIFTSSALSLCLRNITNYDRFVILKYWYHTFTPKAGVTTAYNNDQYHFEWFQRMRIPITYNSTAGAITEITQNNLFLVAGTDGATDDIITMSGRARVRFTDGS